MHWQKHHKLTLKGTEIVQNKKKYLDHQISTDSKQVETVVQLGNIDFLSWKNDSKDGNKSSKDRARIPEESFLDRRRTKFQHLPSCISEFSGLVAPVCFLYSQFLTRCVYSSYPVCKDKAFFFSLQLFQLRETVWGAVFKEVYPQRCNCLWTWFRLWESGLWDDVVTRDETHIHKNHDRRLCVDGGSSTWHHSEI